MKAGATLTLLAGLGAVTQYAFASPPPSNFSEDFQASRYVVGNAFATTPGTDNLQRRYAGTTDPNPPHMDYPQEIMVRRDSDPRIDKYISWDPNFWLGTDAHVRINNSWNSDTDFQWSVKFTMRATVPVAAAFGDGNAGWDQGFQWAYKKTDGTSSTILVGRHSRGGIGMGGNGTPLSNIPNIYGLYTDPTTPSAAGDYAKWANIRIQKLGSYVRVKGWGLNVPEPTWDEALAAGTASGSVIADYAGPLTEPSDNGEWANPNAPTGWSPVEAGMRFKWSGGLDIDNVAFRTVTAGDADADGDVDGDDVAKWAVNFTGALTNPTAPKLWTEGDWDNDGDVDGDDVAKWAVNFTGALTGGLTVTAPGASPEAIAMLEQMGINVAVPEPASLGLLALGALAMLRRRRA